MTVRLIKRAIQYGLRSRGYRLVPRARDAYSLRSWLYSQPIKTVVDVGAASGETVKEWMQVYPAATVHGVEPLPGSFESLRKLEDVSRRFRAWNFAAGPTDGEALFYAHPDHPTSSSVLPRTSLSAKALPFTERQVGIPVSMKRLDTFFDEAVDFICSPMLLKLDVQGFELPILEGASGKFLSKVDFLQTEVSLLSVYEGQSSFDSIHRLLVDQTFVLVGFLEQVHMENDFPLYADVLYVKQNKLPVK